MNKHYDRYLVKHYPILYQGRHKSPKHTCMCWGFECGDGWFNLINSLSFVLEMISRKYHIQIVATQIKEKYGTLRFYYDWYYWWGSHYYRIPDKFWWLCELRGKVFALFLSKSKTRKLSRLITVLIDNAERVSHHICEQCGAWGKTRGTGWLVTLCDKHYKEYQNEHRTISNTD